MQPSEFIPPRQRNSSPCGSRSLVSNALGVDGCRAGWFAFDGCEGRVFESFKDVVALGSDIYIDIPIGLTDEHHRRLESMVRRQVPGRSSSVFPVPVRDAVYAASFEEACRLNKAVTGKKVTLQAWHICRKIREVDTWLIEHPGDRQRVHESHPELVFLRLNGGPLKFRKKTREGIEERVGILGRFRQAAMEEFEASLSAYRRRDVARDDIVDAMALSVLGLIEREIIDDGADSHGIPIRMAIPSVT